MDEIISIVAQRTGLTPEDAAKVVTVVIDTLKSRLPAPIASQIEPLLAGNLSGGLGNIAQEAGELLKGRLGTILGGKT
jgi:hypothetical protein